MKIFYFLVILLVAMLIIVGTVLIQQPTPLIDTITPHEQAVAWLTLDIEIHKSFLARPEEPIYAEPYINTGTHKHHQQWINDFTEILKYINNEPSNYNKEECIEILKKAQATHVGIISCDYSVLLWNYEWFERYDKIIKILK